MVMFWTQTCLCNTCWDRSGWAVLLLQPLHWAFPWRRWFHGGERGWKATKYVKTWGTEKAFEDVLVGIEGSMGEIWGDHKMGMYCTSSKHGGEGEGLQKQMTDKRLITPHTSCDFIRFCVSNARVAYVYANGLKSEPAFCKFFIVFWYLDMI